MENYIESIKTDFERMKNDPKFSPAEVEKTRKILSDFGVKVA